MLVMIYRRDLINSEKIGLLNLKFFRGELMEINYEIEFAKLV